LAKLLAVSFCDYTIPTYLGPSLGDLWCHETKGVFTLAKVKRDNASNSHCLHYGNNCSKQVNFKAQTIFSIVKKALA